MKTNKFVAYQKVLDCINSVTTPTQWISSLKMVQLHYKMYNDNFLNGSLRHHHYERFNEIINIAKNNESK